MIDKKIADAGLSRKERERLFKRLEIINSAVLLFAEKGYENSTLDEIAEKAEFGKGTIYKYFDNKEEIYSAIIENILSDYYNDLRSINSRTGTFKEFISEMTRMLFRFAAENESEFSVFVRVYGNVFDSYWQNKTDEIKNLVSRIEDLFKTRIRQGLQNKEVKELDPQRFIHLYRFLSLSHIYNLYSSSEEDVNIEKESVFILNVLLQGILENNFWG
ncbi:MAG: hypothetical protein SCALA702_35140 [Melioribacteraceae bacterium]|nr:MAG: hypothetical protein SCALA702_35140 [Melioribacteraceae bacterium]